MAYNFNFDLTRVSRSLFTEIAKFSDKRNVHRRIGDVAERLVKTFKIQELTGLPVSDALRVIEDLMVVYTKNLAERERFERTNNRALFLPHCSRKYMDNRCKARFIPEFSSYICQHCSADCLINKASRIGKERGYDVYVLPGGSCISKILGKRNYDGIVGVACAEEIQLGIKLLSRYGISYQAVPLIKNGCSGTKFALKTLEEIL